MTTYLLTDETIDMLSEKIGEMYGSLGCSKKEVLRAKLLLEEALLKYKSRLGEEIELYFRTYRIFGQYRFCVRLRAPSFDPFTVEENPMAFMLRSIMSGFESDAPTWKYRNLENELVFTVRRKTSVGSLTRLMIALGAAIPLGILLRMLVPQEWLNTFVGDYLNPLTNAYAGLFCVMAIPMTFFAIALSIVHIGDMASVGTIGGRMMRRFFLISLVSVAVLTAPLLPFFDLSGTGEFNLAAKSLYDILIDFIPTDFVSPFLNFNSVHIMIIGAMFGFSLLVLGHRGDTVVKVFEECNLVAVYTNNFLNKFIPVYTALTVFNITTTGDFSRLAGAGKMVAAAVGGMLILMAFYTFYTCFKAKIPLKDYVKTVIPAFLVCLSSANFGAAFNTVYSGMMDAGVDGDTANLSTNLGSVFFQPSCTLMLVFSSLFMAAGFGVEISVTWVLIAILLSVLLVGSIPNVPGAAMSVITLLYAQLGLPSEAVSLMITVYALLQFVTVAADTWCLHGEAIICANKARKGEKTE